MPKMNTLSAPAFASSAPSQQLAQTGTMQIMVRQIGQSRASRTSLLHYWPAIYARSACAFKISNSQTKKAIERLQRCALPGQIVKEM